MVGMSKSDRDSSDEDIIEEMNEIEFADCLDPVAVGDSLPTNKKLCIKMHDIYPPTNGKIPGTENVLYVNDDTNAVLVHNEHFTGQVVFRAKNFHGYTPLDPKTGEELPPIKNSPYFKGHSRVFSLSMSGRFRKEWNADDVMFGTFFQKPVIKPRLYKLGVKFARRIDPSMVTQLDVEKPYICSPLICAMNTVHNKPLSSTELAREKIEGSILRKKLGVPKDLPPPLYLPPFEFGSEKHIEENLMISYPTWHVPPTSSFYRQASSISDLPQVINNPSKRRRWFLNESHRQNFIFHPEMVYSFDFNSPYVDLNVMKLKLGLTIDVNYYLNGQSLRYQCRSRDGKTIFWTIEAEIK